MDNEIQITASLSFAKGNIAKKTASKSFNATLAGTNYKQGTQLVPTTAGGTAIDVTGLANVGTAYIQNNDASNYLTVLNAVSGTALLEILPGEGYTIRFATSVTAPALLANIASVQAEYLILEDLKPAGLEAVAVREW